MPSAAPQRRWSAPALCLIALSGAPLAGSCHPAPPRPGDGGPLVIATDPEDGAIGAKLQQAELDYLVHSAAATTVLAENYVGLPFDSWAS